MQGAQFNPSYIWILTFFLHLLWERPGNCELHPTPTSSWWQLECKHQISTVDCFLPHFSDYIFDWFKCARGSAAGHRWWSHSEVIPSPATHDSVTFWLPVRLRRCELSMFLSSYGCWCLILSDLFGMRVWARGHPRYTTRSTPLKSLRRLAQIPVLCNPSLQDDSVLPVS